MNLDDLRRSIEEGANLRNHEAVAKAFGSRLQIGCPPVSCSYDWEDDIFGDRNPVSFFSTEYGHPEWWEKLWEGHVWLDYPRVHFTPYEASPDFQSYEWDWKHYDYEGLNRPGYGILAFESPASFREMWYGVQEERTNGLIFYGFSTELEGAFISNPNLRKLAMRWRKRNRAS